MFVANETTIYVCISLWFYRCFYDVIMCTNLFNVGTSLPCMYFAICACKKIDKIRRNRQYSLRFSLYTSYHYKYSVIFHWNFKELEMLPFKHHNILLCVIICLAIENNYADFRSDNIFVVIPTRLRLLYNDI